MADTHNSGILRKTDPFVLDETISNLENISPNHHHPLPLGATAGGKSEEERPFLNTPFNQLDDNKYRSPWKDASGGKSSGEADILELEQSANEVWDAYRQLYYGHDAVGSVYVRRKGSGDVSGGRTGTPSKVKNKGGALEALFGIQKKCYGDDNGGDEIARWDSVHTVTIEVPNFEEGTCEYKIKSAVWCRYKPEDVGDVPRTEKSSKKAAGTSPNNNNNSTRLEVFDQAANHWDSKTNNKQPVDLSKGGTPLPPVPAVVTSSAVYTKDTTKVCKVTLSKKQPIPVASHIQNIGTLLEKIETDVRSKLERVDAPKCVEVLQGMYRPSLSPGLKLPSRSKPMGSSGIMARLGGHATGMGVGKGLIGEIALKAKSKGLGNMSGEAPQSGSSSTNKAMEGILANEKKKLKDLETESTSSPSKAPATWTQAGLKKSSSKGSSPTSEGSSSSFKPPGAGTLKRPNLRKADSARTFESSKATPEFMNFRNNLKSTATK
jgi:hypothetical protein